MPTDQRQPTLLIAFTLGFATAVATWTIAYFTHHPSIRATGVYTLVPLILVLIGGACIAARSARERPMFAANIASFIAVLLNLLLLTSVLANEDGTQLRDGAGLVIGGAIAMALIAGSLGAFIANLLPEPKRPVITDRQRWLRFFALVTSVAVLPVLFSGGLVTSHNAGLAVPDWPGSFHANMFLFPLSKMTGGIFYEHAHRLFGSLAGITSIALLIMTFVVERRLWTKVFASVLFLLVLAQGLLGAARVEAADEQDWQQAAATPSALVNHDVTNDFALTTDTTFSILLAGKHGILGQITFAAVLAFVAALAMTSVRLPSLRKHGSLQTAAALFFVATLAQLVMGATARHASAIPDPSGDGAISLATIMVMLHATFAFFVLVFGVIASAFAIRANAHSSLTHTAKTTMGLLGLQIALGFWTLLDVIPYTAEPGATEGSALLATLHQFIGALLIGLAAYQLTWGIGLRWLAEPIPEEAETSETVPVGAASTVS